ncbi:MAG: universal stress protein [Vicinamibacterales bacterium]
MSPAPRRRGPFGSILCPVDFSKHSRTALRYAGAVAARSGGTLTVLFVNDPLLVSAAAAAYDEKALVARSGRELERWVRSILGDRGRDRVTCVSAVGEPARQIERHVRSLGADLIVLGSEGLGGARRLFFGSTTARVLAKTGVPVLAVPPADRAPASKVAGWPAGRMLAAVDLDRRASHDVSAAVDVARWFGLPLSLVHVVEPAAVPAWLSLRPAGHDRARVTRARRRLETLAAGCGDAGAPAIDTHVLAGRPSEQVAGLAADLKAAVLVLTLKGDDRLFGDRQGSTTYHVVQEAGTPVLALPAGWRLPG